MKKIKRIKWLTMMISLALIFIFSVQSTFGYIVTSTPSIINTFKPLQNITGNLTISKTVEHPYGNDYVIPDNIAFDFDIDLGKVYAGYTFSTSEGSKAADSNGKISLSVKPGAATVVEGIDVGTTATVTEKQNRNGFTVQRSASGEVTVSDSGAAASFINTYSPESVKTDASVSGIKVLEGREWKEGDRFEFLLEYDGGNGQWQKIATQTISYTEGQDNYNTFDFSDAVRALEFTNIGTYSFRLSEVKGSLEGMAYDETINYFRISVTDTDMDGKLEIGDISGTQNASVADGNVTVVFNNTFKVPDTPVVPEDITVDVTVNKTVDNIGTEKISPKGFRFALLEQESEKEVTLTTDENGIAIKKLAFSADDIGKTFTYTLTEIDDGRENVTYSTDEYVITVNISHDEESNILIAALTLNGSAAESLTAAFTNRYDYSPKAPSTPQTGDNNTAVVFWLVLMILSGGAMILLTIYKKRWDM